MTRFDLALFNSLRRFWGRSRLLDALGVFLAGTLTYLMVGGMVVFILYAGDSSREKLLVAMEILAAFLLSRVIIAANFALLVKRPRPFITLGFEPPFIPITSGSFPSGHASALFSVALVMLTFDAAWGLAYLALALAVGIGRVFVGVHWPSDILAGILVGLGSGFLVHILLEPSRQAIFG